MLRKLLQPPQWLRWAISLTLIALLLYVTDIREMFSTIEFTSWRWLIAGFGMAITLTSYGAFKWWVLMPRSRASIPTFIRVNFVGNFVGIFVPGIIGIEAARIAGITRSTKDLPAAFASVLVDRLFGLLTIALVVVGSAARSSVVPPAVANLSYICLAGLLVVSYGLMNASARKLVKWIAPGRIDGAIQKLYDCLDLYRDRPRVLLLSLLLSLLFQFGRVFMVYFLAKSLNLDIALSFLMVIVPVVFLVQMLPISIVGIGVRETTMVGMLALVGVSTEAALSLSVLLFIVIITATLPGGILLGLGQASNEPRAGI